MSCLQVATSSGEPGEVLAFAGVYDGGCCSPPSPTLYNHHADSLHTYIHTVHTYIHTYTHTHTHTHTHVSTGHGGVAVAEWLQAKLVNMVAKFWDARAPEQALTDAFLKADSTLLSQKVRVCMCVCVCARARVRPCVLVPLRHVCLCKRACCGAGEGS